ncbi:hypothetical protein BS17DRAFT_818834 [Gyrodon lividus]|nr:hypothetical protein BS17DRAFT_818834 [Gyrodon lividus]
MTRVQSLPAETNLVRTNTALPALPRRRRSLRKRSQKRDTRAHAGKSASQADATPAPEHDHEASWVRTPLMSSCGATPLNCADGSMIQVVWMIPKYDSQSRASKSQGVTPNATPERAHEPCEHGSHSVTQSVGIYRVR